MALPTIVIAVNERDGKHWASLNVSGEVVLVTPDTPHARGWQACSVEFTPDAVVHPDFEVMLCGSLPCLNHLSAR